VYKCGLRTHLGVNGFAEVASIVRWIERMQRAHFEARCGCVVRVTSTTDFTGNRVELREQRVPSRNKILIGRGIMAK
jgi:hypothetical protein